MKPESPIIEDYLTCDDVIDWRAPDIVRKAHEVTESVTEDVQRARRLFEWVRDEIPHSKDANSDVVTCSASEALRRRTGICYAKSHLVAALLRAVGIPSGFCYQVLRRELPHEGFVLHGLNGVYLTELGRWVRVDARGNTRGINAQFLTDEEQLAFPIDSSAGEFIYDVIFVSPARTVVDTLRKYKSRTEMWPHLPCSLE